MYTEQKWQKSFWLLQRITPSRGPYFRAPEPEFWFGALPVLLLLHTCYLKTAQLAGGFCSHHLGV